MFYAKIWNENTNNTKKQKQFTLTPLNMEFHRNQMAVNL